MADGGDGGWEVPWYVVCKLEVLGSWYYNLVQDRTLRNSEDRCCKSLPESETRRTTSVKVREPEKWASESERVNSPFFCLLFCSGSQGWAAARSQWGGPFALLSLPIQMPVSSRNTLTAHQKWCSISYLGIPFAQSRWHIRLTIMWSQTELALPLICCETWGRFAVSLCLSILLHDIDVNNCDYIIGLLRGMIVKI